MTTKKPDDITSFLPEPEVEKEKTGQTNVIERKLVTIISADVAGYSKLMASDEEHTLKVFRGHKKVFEQLVELHRGRIFNTAGDAILAEFSSAVEGVRCATEIQSALRTRNDKLPEGQKVQFRIGVNLGDVVVQGTDLLGDGVNLAARVQTAAEPGGVCISGSVWDQVQNKLSLNVSSLGEMSYKNIPNPVRTFSVVIEKGGHVPSGHATVERRQSKFQGAAFLVASVVMLAVAGATLYFLAKGRLHSSGTTVVVNYDPQSGKIDAKYPDPAPQPAQEAAEPKQAAAQSETTKFFPMQKPLFNRPWLETEGKAKPAAWVVAPGQGSGNARPTIAEALAAAAPGDVIEVRPGTYRETFKVDKSVTLRGLPGDDGKVAVTVEWEGAEAAHLIDGEVSVENMHFVLTSKDPVKPGFGLLVNGARAKLFNVAAFASGASGSSGLSLRSGEALLKASEFRGARGIDQMGGKLECQGCNVVDTAEEGVVVLNQGNDPDMKTLFRKLRVVGSGATGVVLMSQASATLEDCELSRNTVHGLMLLGTAKAKVSGCQLGANKENGVVLADEARAELREVKAFGNGQSGFAATLNAQLEVRDSEVTENGEFGFVALNEARIREPGNKNMGNRNGPAWRAPASGR